MRSQYVITASYFHPLTKILSTLFLGFTPLYKLEAGYKPKKRVLRILVKG